MIAIALLISSIRLSELECRRYMGGKGFIYSNTLDLMIACEQMLKELSTCEWATKTKYCHKK